MRNSTLACACIHGALIAHELICHLPTIKSDPTMIFKCPIVQNYIKNSCSISKLHVRIWTNKYLRDAVGEGPVELQPYHFFAVVNFLGLQNKYDSLKMAEQWPLMLVCLGQFFFFSTLPLLICFRGPCIWYPSLFMEYWQNIYLQYTFHKFLGNALSHNHVDCTGAFRDDNPCFHRDKLCE